MKYYCFDEYMYNDRNIVCTYCAYYIITYTRYVFFQGHQHTKIHCRKNKEKKMFCYIFNHREIIWARAVGGHGRSDGRSRIMVKSYKCILIHLYTSGKRPRRFREESSGEFEEAEKRDVRIYSIPCNNLFVAYSDKSVIKSLGWFWQTFMYITYTDCPVYHPCRF